MWWAYILVACGCTYIRTTMDSLISEEEIQRYQRDGAVVVRNVFGPEWIKLAAAGIERNLANPSVYASENQVGEREGRFFDDYCNWTSIEEFQRLVFDSPAAQLAARAMRSQSAQFFHDHVLVKEPFTKKPTPWHADMPYYFVDGMQNVSMWIPMEPVDTASLRFIAGSHTWEKMVLPVSWSDDSDFYDSTNDFNLRPSGGRGGGEKPVYEPVPDPDKWPGKYNVLEWAVNPGDVVLFHFRTCHAARGNLTGSRRRALSLRWVGDDCTYITRPGRTSPPFPNHNMTDGQTLRKDWFPIVYTQGDDGRSAVGSRRTSKL